MQRYCLIRYSQFNILRFHVDYDKASNTCKTLTLIENKSSTSVPIARAGHSHIAYRETDPEGNQGAICIYVFGGHDEENNKLNDIWKFNCSSATWN